MFGGRSVDIAQWILSEHVQPCSLGLVVYMYSLLGFESQEEMTAIKAYLPQLSLTASVWTGGIYDSHCDSYKWIGSDTLVDGSMFESGLDSLDSNRNVCLRSSNGKLAAFNNGIGFAAICEDYAEW